MTHSTYTLPFLKDAWEAKIKTIFSYKSNDYIDADSTVANFRSNLIYNFLQKYMFSSAIQKFVIPI